MEIIKSENQNSARRIAAVSSAALIRKPAPIRFVRRNVDGFLNWARICPAKMAQTMTLTAARVRKVASITANWVKIGIVGSTNCGTKAMKKAMLFGFSAVTMYAF